MAPYIAPDTALETTAAENAAETADAPGSPGAPSSPGSPGASASSTSPASPKKDQKMEPKIDQMDGAASYSVPGSFKDVSDSDDEQTPKESFIAVVLPKDPGSPSKIEDNAAPKIKIPLDPKAAIFLDGAMDMNPAAGSGSASKLASEYHEQTVSVENYFTGGSGPRALSPIPTESADPDLRQTLSMHKDSDLYIQTKNKNGLTIIFEVNSAILAAASPVFRKMMYGPSHRPLRGDWIISLNDDNAKALRHVFGILHFRFNKDCMRMRTKKEIGQILALVHKYQLGDIIYPFAKKWSADLTHALTLADESDPSKSVQTLWIAYELADLKNFKKSLVDVIFWACMNRHGTLCGPHGEPMEDLPFSQTLVDTIEFNRSEVIGRILRSLSEPIDNLMAPDEVPNVQYCKSIDSQADCQSTILGSILTSLSKARMWPLPKPEKYEESVYRLQQIVGSLRITALIFPGRPPHEQRHLRCGIEHKEVLEDLKSFMPFLPDSILEDMKRRGQMMDTFDEEAWAPYKSEDKWDDIDMEPEDSIADDGWDE